jgi:hypothetical protein
MATTSIPSTTDKHALHGAEARCAREGEARDKFEQLLGYVRGEAKSQQLHEGAQSPDVGNHVTRPLAVHCGARSRAAVWARRKERHAQVRPNGRS